MSLDAQYLSSMRRELVKLATQGYGPPPHEYEELTKPRLRQALKDIPISILGGALGYGVGRTGAEFLLPHLFDTPVGHELLAKNIGAASAITSGLGTYLLSKQYALLKQRRDQADANSKLPKPKPEMGGTEPIAGKVETKGPENEPSSKLSSNIVPAVAQARRIDPWREDRRYPKFLG